MASKSVTLLDIAQKLGVSVVTVSKALRDHPDISVKTTKLIKQLAEELEYTPNYMARNLSARRSHMIGLIVPKIAHFFFGSIIEHIYDIAFSNNYEIILTVSQESAEREKKHVHTLLSMKVDGIIISVSQETKDYEIFETIRKRGVPLLFMDRIPQIDRVNKVSVNDREGAFKAIDHAIKVGYRNIAHFAGYTEINIGYQRYLGFKDAMNINNVPINPDWVTRGGFGEKYGYDAFMDLYNKKNLPDLIFTVTYPVALGVYIAAAELGLKIPQDIDVICFGNARVQEFLSPPLSCVNQPTDKIAKESMNILFENIMKREEDFKVKEAVIETDLILRGTCISYKENYISENHLL